MPNSCFIIIFQTPSRCQYTNILEFLLTALGVQILWYYSEVFGPGGTISGGSIFFVTVLSDTVTPRPSPALEVWRTAEDQAGVSTPFL